VFGCCSIFLRLGLRPRLRKNHGCAQKPRLKTAAFRPWDEITILCIIVFALFLSEQKNCLWQSSGGFALLDVQDFRFFNGKLDDCGQAQASVQRAGRKLENSVSSYSGRADQFINLSVY
jgi:hypothetical protein